MSKNKNSTNSEVVLTETAEEIKTEEVVLENVETEEKVETIFQETEPSKTEIKKSVVFKEKGKVIGTTKTMLCLQLKDGSQKMIKKPNYPVKIGDMIDTTI